MIIFYSKETGKIEGIIEGRLHGKDHLNMWIGDRDITDRIICQWKKNENKWEPDITDRGQKEIMLSLDGRTARIRDYKIDVESKKLVSK